MANPRIALLIDGDNISPKLFPEILQRAETFGDLILKRIFGDFSDGRHADWVQLARDHGMELVFQPCGGKAKNSVDIAMTIGAMDILHEGRMSGFCLVSSDRDFAPLALRLRRSGLNVYGIGEGKSAESLRSAFTAFFLIEKQTEPKATTPLPIDLRIAELVHDAAGPDGKWMVPSAMAARIIERNAELAAILRGKGKFMRNLRATGLIEEIGTGPNLRIRRKLA